MRTIGSVIFYVMMLCCASAGPATQPTTQPHEETAIERAYRRLHERQAAEKAGTTQPTAKAPERSFTSYPVKIANEMNASLNPGLPDNTTSINARAAVEAEKEAINRVASSHVGDNWEFSGRLVDVKDGISLLGYGQTMGFRQYGVANRPGLQTPEAVAIFDVILPLPDWVSRAIDDRIRETRATLPIARAKDEISRLNAIRLRAHCVIEVEGTNKDFANWRRDGFYTVRLVTANIDPVVERHQTGLTRRNSTRHILERFTSRSSVCSRNARKIPRRRWS